LWFHFQIADFNILFILFFVTLPLSIMKWLQERGSYSTYHLEERYFDLMVKILKKYLHLHVYNLFSVLH